MSTAYFGLLRVGEVTESQHIIKAKDVHISDNKNKMMFVLRTSKTHWKDVKLQVVTISSTAVPHHMPPAKPVCRLVDQITLTCPFLLLEQYLMVRRRRKQPDEQFFVFRDRSLVKPSHMRLVLKNVLTAIGLNPSNYGCHSYRIGRAIDLFVHAKLDVNSIKKLGHWSSNVVYTYLK